jgi:sirohydrochlorin ferrochelatase
MMEAGSRATRKNRSENQDFPPQYSTLQYNKPTMSKACPPGLIKPPRGLLLVGHGSRDAQGLAEFECLAQKVIKLATEFAVEPCFLELAEPDIPTAVRRLIELGIEQLTVAPVLLFAAGHAQRDIPAEVAKGIGFPRSDCSHNTSFVASAAVASRVVVDQLPPLECHRHIVELSSTRFQEALVGRPPVELDDTLLVMVGRGSSYSEATASMGRFAELRSRQTPVGGTKICFVAVGKPNLAEGLLDAANSQFRRIVVQPHLLFAGQVLSQILQSVTKCAELHPKKEWITTGHLGPSPLIAEAIIDRTKNSKQEE